MDDASHGWALRMRISLPSLSFSKFIILLTAAVLLFSSFGAISLANATSNSDSKDGRLVTIHDRGEKRVILTHAQTVRDALKDAQVSVVGEDLVEPGIDEQLGSTDYTVNIYRARPVIVVDGAVRQKIMTAAQTSKAIAKDASIVLRDEDTATLSSSDNIVADGAGVVLSVNRATEFKLKLYGAEKTAYTQEKTVGAMLDKKGIKLGKDDTLSVDRKTPVVAGMSIAIWRDGVQTTTVEEEVKFPIRQIQDVEKPVGYKKVQTAGTVGKKSVTYEIVMKGGVEISRKAIQTVVLEQPKEQVEVVGAKSNYSESLESWLLALRTCETGNNYARNSGNGYYGAYQFLPSTWNSVAKKTGRNDLVGVLPSNANPADQDAMVIANTNMTAGLSTQHPGCYKKLGLANKPPQN